MNNNLAFIAGLACYLIIGSINFASSAPTTSLHSLNWKVHIDLIDIPAGKDLAYYQAFINQQVHQANLLLQGHHGPVDVGCCIELDPVSVTTFGTNGDGLNTIINGTQFSQVQGFGDGAYLVQFIHYCNGGFNMGIRGCAATPGDLLVVGLEADENQFLPEVIAHERGHNAGLDHVSNNPCELMSASNGGGCLSTSECNAFISKADSSGGTCNCLANILGDPPEPLGQSCGSGLVCSQGVCGQASGLYGVRLLASAGVDGTPGEAPNDFIEQSAVTGGWSTLGSDGPTISGLAYDSNADILYGLHSLPGDDALVTLNLANGAILSTVGTLLGKDNATALSFDPRPEGNRLLAIQVDDDFFGTDCAHFGIDAPCYSELFEIDPSNATTTRLGELNGLIIFNGVTGLAWNNGAGRLYGTTAAGISEILLATCDGFQCPDATPVDNLFRAEGSLAWVSGLSQLLATGGDGFGGSQLHVVDPSTGESSSVVGTDPFQSGGLEAILVPEPGFYIGVITAFLGLVLAGRLKARR